MFYNVNIVKLKPENIGRIRTTGNKTKNQCNTQQHKQQTKHQKGLACYAYKTKRGKNEKRRK